MPTNAKVDIKVGIQIRYRVDTERFRPTRVWNSSFSLATDTTSASGAIPAFANSVFAEVLSARNAGLETFTHVGIRLDNPSHPVAAKGVVPLAKGHLDGQLADGDFPDAMTLQTLLTNAVQYMAEQAKYTA